VTGVSYTDKHWTLQTICLQSGQLWRVVQPAGSRRPKSVRTAVKAEKDRGCWRIDLFTGRQAFEFYF